MKDLAACNQYRGSPIIFAAPAFFHATDGGSAGQPLPFEMPGAGSARECTTCDTFPDGAE